MTRHDAEAARPPWQTALWIGGAIVMLAAGLALRLWHLFAEPLWLDEAYSAYAADHGLGFLWRVVPAYETHPPFYYTLLHLWVRAAGDGLVALRLPGLAAGLATLPLLGLAAGEGGRLLGWRGPRRAIWAGCSVALGCVAIELVEMARQVRPYPLMILAYAAAGWLLLRIGRLGFGRRRIAGHLALVELMLWLHNLGPLYALTLSAALVLALPWRGLTRADWGWLVGGHALVALCYLPGLAILLGQAPTWVSSTWLRLTPANVLDHLQLLYAAPGWPVLAAIVLIAMAFAGARRWPGGGRLAGLLAVLALGPVVLALGLSLAVSPVFITRTVSPAAVPVMLLYGLGIAAWDGWRRWLGVGLALWLGANMALIDLLDRRAGPMQDWYGAVEWLRPRLGPGDRVLAYPNEGALPLHYALRDRGLSVPIDPIPAPVPAFAGEGAWYPTGSRGVVSLEEPQLRAIAERPALRGMRTIWLLRLAAPVYDDGDVFLRLLRRDRIPVGRWRAGPIEIVGLRRRI